MKLEHCKIEQFDGEASIELGFSVPFGVSAELVTEIGRRIEHFLAPFHTPASEPAVPANMPEAEVVTAGVATVVAPAKRTRTPKAGGVEDRNLTVALQFFVFRVHAGFLPDWCTDYMGL